MAGKKSPVSRAVEKPVPEWLVLGSFQHPERTRLLDWPFVPERELAPSPGEKLGRMVWLHVRGQSVDLLSAGLSATSFCTAYMFTYIRAAKAGPAKLLVGSDDGVAVWLNGAEVWRHDVQRAHTAGEDVVPVNLEKGWNRLLLKVSQFDGGWAASCTVAAECELAFSLRNPEPRRWPGVRRNAADPAIAGAALARASGAECELAVHVYNFGGREADGARLSLVDAGGRAVASAEPQAIPPYGFAKLVLRTGLVELASALGSEGAAFRLEWRKARPSAPVPDEICLRLLPWVARAAASGSDELGAIAQELEGALEAYRIDFAAVAADSRKALAACAAGDAKSLTEMLRRVLKSALASVPDRKKTDRAHVVGHAHIDMNWLWTYPETVKSCHDTFRQVIAFMDEFEDFTFIQSQASTYRAIEEIDPPLFERIRERIREGRWELGGGMFAEGDTNMSSGEALARSFLLAQRYFLDRFGKCARVGWLPDNFGHVSQLPQILRLAGCEFFYFHRCKPYLGTFWWEAPDGSKVLCYANNTYNGRVTRDISREFDLIVPDKRRLLFVCGVGDHGGGPTRSDIETAHRLDATPLYPSISFTTAERFFREAEKEMEGRPTHKGEMQFTFEGCYTSVARVKEGNRRAESALFAAELLASLRRIQGAAYPADELRRSWEIVTFNEFHDILCGSAIHESNQDAVADYKWAISRAEHVRDSALRSLADEVKTSPGKGQPVVVFNPSPRQRTALVEAELYTDAPPAAARLAPWGDFYGSHRVGVGPGASGDLPSVMLRDNSGRAIPAQVVWGKDFPPGWRWRVQFVAEALPACGYRTFYVDASRPSDAPSPIAEEKGRFETDFFRVGFDMKTGEIASLYDKRTRREFAAKGGGLNRLRVYLEAPHGMSAWTIGETSRVEDVRDTESVKITERGPVRACVEAVKRWGRSMFVQRTYLYRSYPRIDFELEAHWFEQGSPSQEAPMLRVVFPLALEDARFNCHVPFDVVERPSTGREVPAQQWVDVSDGRSGVALLNRTKYGHSFEKGELRLTLLRSSYDPDIYPDQGLHRISYALFPHAGDWREGVWAEGEAFNCPPLAVEPPSRSLGTDHARLPDELSFLAVEPAGVVLSGVKEAETGGEIVIRLAEVEGRATEAVLTLPADARAARRLDLIERPLEGAAAPELRGRRLSVALRPHEIATLGVSF